jgi:hypothetical protein
MFGEYAEPTWEAVVDAITHGSVNSWGEVTTHTLTNGGTPVTWWNWQNPFNGALGFSQRVQGALQSAGIRYETFLFNPYGGD